MTWRVLHGDCIDAMAAMDEASVDAIVTDPPYGLGFMGREWDDLPPGLPWAQECLRVLKPGGHLLAFGGTRTYHRLTCAVEDAGFEIRDCIAWMYGSGFPKGKGCLKPAFEPIVMARKPGTKGVVLNIDACRVAATSEDVAVQRARTGGVMGESNTDGIYGDKGRTPAGNAAGRWPANVVLDPEAGALLDEQTQGVVHGAGAARDAGAGTHSGERIEGWGNMGAPAMRFGDSGGASRFFYCAKTSSRERNNAGAGWPNLHPTVKPIALMQWLVRLVTPPGGLVLDPFAGSGTTGIAALREGFSFVGVEREAEYVALARARILGDSPLHNAGGEVAA